MFVSKLTPCLAQPVKQIAQRNASITAVKGREVIDSRGNPTVEVRTPSA